MYDASYGLLLTGNGRGDFKAVSPQQSGVVVKGAVRDITELKAGNKKADNFLPKNNEKTEVLIDKKMKMRNREESFDYGFAGPLRQITNELMN